MRGAVTVSCTGVLSRRYCLIALAIGLTTSLIVYIALAAQWFHVGWVTGRWAYGFVLSYSASTLIVGVLAAATAATTLRLPVPDADREWLVVALWLAIGLAIQVFVRSLTPFSFAHIFASDGANSFYSFAQQHDALTALTDFDRVRATAPLHAQSNMPGKLMLVYALQLVSGDAGVIAWLITFVSNLGAPLMYVFVRDLFGDRKTAVYAMVLYLFVPAKLVFMPLMNTVTPVVILGCVCLLQRWLRLRTAASAALLGASLYGLVFFEPLPLVMGLLFAALTFRAVVIGSMTTQTVVLHVSAVVLAFIATAEAAHLAFDFDLLETFGKIREHAMAFNTAESRPYRVWILANLWEFSFGTGPAQSVLFGAAALAIVTARPRPADLLRDPASMICVGLLAVLVATDLIGINRGEVVRLWIFLACFFQIPAAWICARLEHPYAIVLVAGSSIILAALGTHTIGFIIP